MLNHVVRTADVVIAHSRIAAAYARETLARSGPILLAPHGNYIDAYPAPADGARRALRNAIGVPEEAPVALFFGQIRADKEIVPSVRQILRATPDVWVVVAGAPTSAITLSELCDLERTETRLRVLPAHVPDAEVAQLFAASDLSIHSQPTAISSGAMILSLSLGVPVVVSSQSVGIELGVPPAVFSHDGDVGSAVVAALAVRARERQTAAGAAALQLSWSASARVHRDAYEIAMQIVAEHRRLGARRRRWNARTRQSWRG
jgi:hypothetical protein